jgi:hypothetical protein
MSAGRQSGRNQESAISNQLLIGGLWLTARVYFAIANS